MVAVIDDRDAPHRWTVGDHDWLVHQRPHEPGCYDIEWLSGPNPGYGFTVASSNRTSMSRVRLEREIQSFLAGIDPATGHLG